MELIDFNPRSREGSDRVEKESRRRMCYFNPRSREGSDYVVRLWCHEYAISIHAPARGATIYISGLIFVPVISIHAPARGATPAARRQAGRMSISIHAPARGATQHLVGQGSEQVISIHAPARGATFTPPAFLSIGRASCTDTSGERDGTCTIKK